MKAALGILLLFLFPLLLMPSIKYASANFDYHPPRVTVISPVTDMTYDSQASIALNVKVEMFSWDGSFNWEQLAEVKYSLDGQPDCLATIENKAKSGAVEGFATATLSGVTEGAHSLFIHGKTTLSKSSEDSANFEKTVFFIVGKVTPTIQVLSPQQKTYYSKDVSLEFKSDKPLTWAGYSLDQKMVVKSLTKTVITNLFNGEHYLRFYGNDTDGNICASQEIVFTINGKKPPVVTIDGQAIAEARKRVPSDYGNRSWTYLPLKFSVNEPATWTGCSIDGGEIQTIEVNMTLSNVPFGEHTIIVYAKDICGNMGASEPFMINLLRGVAGSAYASPNASQTELQELIPENNPSPSNDLSTIGLAVASTTLLALAACTCVLLYKRKHRKQSQASFN
jgi:hypothetical protein